MRGDDSPGAMATPQQGGGFAPCEVCRRGVVQARGRCRFPWAPNDTRTICRAPAASRTQPHLAVEWVSALAVWLPGTVSTPVPPVRRRVPARSRTRVTISISGDDAASVVTRAGIAEARSFRAADSGVAMMTASASSPSTTLQRIRCGALAAFLRPHPTLGRDLSPARPRPTSAPRSCARCAPALPCAPSAPRRMRSAARASTSVLMPPESPRRPLPASSRPPALPRPSPRRHHAASAPRRRGSPPGSARH